MTLGVLSQMVFPVKRSSALDTDVSFLARMNYLMEIQLFFTFKRFTAYGTRERPLRTVAQSVPGQVVLAFQPGVTDIAHVPPFHFYRYRMAGYVFAQQEFVQKFGGTFRASVHGRAVVTIRYSYFRRWNFCLRYRLRRRIITIVRLRSFRSLFPLFGFLRRVVLFSGRRFAVSRILQKMMQRERCRQMGQVIGYRWPGRGYALPRSRHPVGARRQFAAAVVVVGVLLRVVRM